MTRSLRVRLSLLVLATMVCVWSVISINHYRKQEELDLGNARLRAELLADTINAVIVAEMTESDHSGAASRVARSIGAVIPDTSIYVIGRSGVILGAYPPKPAKIDPLVDPDCVECHSAQKDIPYVTLATNAQGADVVQIFKVIPATPKCNECHEVNGGQALGFVYAHVPISELLKVSESGFVTHMLQLAVSILITLLVLGWGLNIWVEAPLKQLTDYFRGLAEGGREEPPSEDLPVELLELQRACLETGEAYGALSSGFSEGAERAILDCARLKKLIDELEDKLSGEVVAEHDAVVMMEQFEKEVGQIQLQTEVVAQSAQDNSQILKTMSESIDYVAQNADKLAGKVVQTDDSLTLMRDSVHAVSEHVDLLARRAEKASRSADVIDKSSSLIRNEAHDASQLSGKMASTAMEGVKALDASLSGINRSYGEILAAAESMRQLQVSSRSVGKILKIIDEINEKTKLLALNAAIIAAQAGEQGHSFSVVAHEIKSLSDRTTASTGDISRIIETIQEGIEVAIHNVQHGEDRLGESVELVGRAGKLLGTIEQTAQVAYEKSVKISSSADSQSELSDTVSNSVSDVTGMVEEIRSRVREHRRSGELVDQAVGNMRDLTEHLKLGAKEQAETSRFLSEAFSIIDSNISAVISTIAEEHRVSVVAVRELKALEEQGREDKASVEGVVAALERLRASVEGLGEIAGARLHVADDVAEAVNGERGDDAEGGEEA